MRALPSVLRKAPLLSALSDVRCPRARVRDSEAAGTIRTPRTRRREVGHGHGGRADVIMSAWSMCRAPVFRALAEPAHRLPSIFSSRFQAYEDCFSRFSCHIQSPYRNDMPNPGKAKLLTKKYSAARRIPAAGVRAAHGAAAERDARHAAPEQMSVERDGTLERIE